MSKALTWLQESYVFAIDGIEAHPHLVLWSVLGLIVLTLVV